MFELLAIDEPSLDAPPVYRRFLAGGSESLRPGRFALLALLLIGVGLLGVAWLIFLPEGRSAGLAFLWNAVGALACAVVLVWMTSRWVGSRLGLLAGFIWLCSAAVLQAEVETWLAAIGCLAMGLFAVAQVAGRLPTRAQPGVRWAFHATVGLSLLVFGPVAALSMLGTCLVFLLMSQHTRAVGFLINPAALTILAAAALGRWFMVGATWDGHGAIWFDTTFASGAWTSRLGAMPTRLAAIATDALPWMAPALIAASVGLCQGHYATPFWRFLGCWILVSVGWSVLGAADSAVARAAVIPPMCVLAAAALAWTAVRAGRALRRTSRPRGAHRGDARHAALPDRMPRTRRRLRRVGPTGQTARRYD